MILQAQPEIGDFGPESIYEPLRERPFFIQAYADSISKAKISKSPFKGQHLTFNEVEATITATYLFNPAYCEGLYASLGYDLTNCDWKDNIFFNDKHFHTAIFSLGAISGRLPGWFWNTYGSINMDIDHFNFNDYTTYDFMLWGRYTYSCNVGLHIGVLALTGLRIYHVYPIVGFDWRINHCLKLNAVFPMNISLIYMLDPNWSIAIAGRFWDSRHRANKHAPLPKGIFNYRNYGAEFAINYDYNSWMRTNIHAGYTFGGILKIADKDNDKKLNLDFDGAPYFGAEFELKF